MANVGIVVHDLGSREIRVRFDASVGSDALDVSKYALTSGTGVVPSISEVVWWDADHLSVALRLNQALTQGQVYSCQVVGLAAESGEPITATPYDFTANAFDWPQVSGAFLSLRGHVDIVCDRPVGIFSIAAAASLRDAAAPPGTGIAMTLIPWMFGMQENAVRFGFAAAPIATEYAIDFSDIIDQSSNSCIPGSIPLELTYPVTGFADLVQARITSANILSMSNARYAALATIRVFFNCPMLNADVINIANWAVTQPGSHRHGDTLHVIATPDATDIASLVTLVNAVKAALNSHIPEVGYVHLAEDLTNIVTMADATPLTVFDVTREVERKVLAHFESPGIHTYFDTFNEFPYNNPSYLAMAIFVANETKAKFNAHLQAIYPVSFASTRPIVTYLGDVSNFASTMTNNSPISDQWTWFADLHVISPTINVPITVSVTASSEDGGSTTNPISTGLAIAPPYADHPLLFSITRDGNSSLIRFNSGVRPDSIRAFEVVHDFVITPEWPFGVDDITHRPLRVSDTTSANVPMVWWALTDLMNAYTMHLDMAYGGGHYAPDGVHSLGPWDFINVLDLPTIINVANYVAIRMNGHITDMRFHFDQDNVVSTAAQATDMESLLTLLSDMQFVLWHHNNSASGVYSISPPPRFPGVHAYCGQNLMSASLTDLMRIEFPGFADGAEYIVDAQMTYSWFDSSSVSLKRENRFHTSMSFSGLALRPSLASALPRPGYDASRPNRLLSDAVEFFFSRPMLNSGLGASNFSVVGGTMLIGDVSWTGARSVAMRVSRMETIPYAINAINLYDSAGNPIF